MRSDAELITSCNAGEPLASVAFRELYDRYHALVFRTGMRFYADRALAADLTQEVFIKVWKALAQFDLSREFRPWLMTIAIRTAIDFKRNEKLQIMQDPEQAVAFNQDLEYTELLAFLRKCAAELPKQQQAVFILRDLEGYSPEEVSELLQMELGQIKSNLYYARQKVSTWLKKNYE